jgi:hypothetical protein
MDASPNIRFALANRAGTTPPRFFQRNKTLAAIVPFDGQFIPDGLEVERAH